MTSPQSPVPLALIICEERRVAPNGVNYALIGTFDTVYGQGFPCKATKMYAHVDLTDFVGELIFTIQLVNAADDTVLCGREVSCRLDDPRKVASAGVDACGAPFHKPGEFLWQVIHEGAILIQRRLIVALDPGPEKRWR